MINKIINLINKRILRYQFIRFAVVGTSGAILDFSILIILTEIFSIYYLASSVVAFILANLSNFIWNKLWTFRNTSDKHIRQLLSFAIVGVIGLGINTGV